MMKVSTQWLIESLKICAQNRGCEGCCMHGINTAETCGKDLMRIAARRLASLEERR